MNFVQIDQNGNILQIVTGLEEPNFINDSTQSTIECDYDVILKPQYYSYDTVNNVFVFNANKFNPDNRKQDILDELAQLDSKVPRISEDLLTHTGCTIYPATQAIIDRKNELRSELATLA